MVPLWSGTLRKMRVEPTAPVTYRLADGCHDAARRAPDRELNALLGARVELRFAGAITCVACGRAIPKTFGEGYCYPCFTTLAEADQCIVKPHLCHYHDVNNPCRDSEFALAHCFRPHVLYASLTSAFKIGITRRANVPARWIDQGAVAAIPLAELPSRREVGLVEHALAERFPDRTHWMRMLREERPEGDLPAFAAAVVAALGEMNVAGVLPEPQRVAHTFRYPVRRYPDKVKSLDLGKLGVVAGVLEGIKGQYLLLDAGVINLRKYTGYAVEVSAEAVA